MIKLSNSVLPALSDGVRPAYARAQVQPGIVHLGLGAFHRAHQAVYTHTVLESGDLRWGIAGASLMSEQVKQALHPQDGLYTLIESSDEGLRMRVIGSVVEVLGPQDTQQLLERMSAVSTCIVSITVTEKGYHLDPSTGGLQLRSAAITQDLAQPEAPQTVPGLITQALKMRRAAGRPPFTVLSCDNLPSNGKRTRAAVVAYARELDPTLADWIDAQVAFPCTMVDRITPATTDVDREQVARSIGVQDAWPVVTEPFTQWVIEDHFTLGRPDWSLAGAVFSNEIERWEEMKLRLLNGAHSALAYLGQLAGHETVFAAMNDPAIESVLDALWQELAQVTDLPQGVEVQGYIDSLKRRFKNPAIQHRTAQIAMDGSQKLPLRLLAPLRTRLQRGLPSPAIASALAAWMHHVSAVTRSGERLADPLADAIAAIAAALREDEDSRTQVAAFLSLHAIFGPDLPQATTLQNELIQAFEQLADHSRFVPAK